MKTVLKYPGAKNRVAEWIVGHIPEHEVYIEPYFGGGGVFFNKPKSHIETINDLNDNVVNYFKVLRDYGEEFREMIEFTPYSREEYERAYIEENESEIEKARKFAVRCWQGFGCSNLYKNGFRSGQQGKSPSCSRAWDLLPYTLWLATERLKDAQIEKLPALELLDRYNTEDVFIYADPPYLHTTRKNYLYKHEMTEEDHVELLEKLIEHPGRILLSGYDNELYNTYLDGWEKAQKDTTAEQGLARTETLWMNYLKQTTIFDFIK